MSATARAVVLQRDGKIVVAGWADDGGDRRLVVWRLRPGGRLDRTFSGDGMYVARDPAWSLSGAEDLVVQPGGKIVAAGFVYAPTGYEFALVRLRPGGSPDPTFGTGGKASAPVGGASSGFTASTARALALRPDGKLVVTGIAYGTSNHYDFAIAQFRRNGDLDPSFGTGGSRTTEVGSFHDHVWALVLQPNGKAVVAGTAYPSAVSSTDFALVRYTAAASPTPPSGDAGKKIVGLGSGHDEVHALALQRNGKIVAAGQGTETGVASYAAFVRLKPNGDPDPAFSGDGERLMVVNAHVDGLGGPNRTRSGPRRASRSVPRIAAGTSGTPAGSAIRAAPT